MCRGQKRSAMKTVGSAQEAGLSLHNSGYSPMNVRGPVNAASILRMRLFGWAR
jgi:hypothetical protein